MNKKIFIGSIIAVTILIGVSFTSVVGYRSGASSLMVEHGLVKKQQVFLPV